jgi:ABC transport system ATP-binding/permease protein
MYELPEKVSSLSETKAPITLEKVVGIPPVSIYTPTMVVEEQENKHQVWSMIDQGIQKAEDEAVEKVSVATKLGKEDRGIRIDATHLEKVSKNKTILLHDISLVIPAGSLVAVVGSSGTGKSTLLNMLNGMQSAQQGQIYYNGYNFYQYASFFHSQLGYVPQDDIVHPNLTVAHALYYAAKMRLPEYTEYQVRERVKDVLTYVGLTERRDLLISKLSGGQRKRVSIALELLDEPKVFFLDEPTSGLDPGLDYKMMHLLRSMTDRGQTVVVSTHATSNIMICDYICFLASGGRLVYFGPPDKALVFFQQETFEKIYPTLEASAEQPEVPAEAEKRFKASEDYHRYVREPLTDLKQVPPLLTQRSMLKKTARRYSSLKQFWILSVRYLELLKNDTGNLLILLLQAPVIVILLVALMKYEIGTTMFTQDSIAKCPTGITVFTTIGLPNIPTTGQIYSNSCIRVKNALQYDPKGRIYAQRHGGVNKAIQDFIALSSGDNAQKILFIMSFTAVLFGCVNAVREIVKEGPIYRRERAVHLGILPYMFSKIIVLSVLCLIQDVVMLVVINLVAPFTQGGIVLPLLLEIYITLVLTSLSGLMIGLAVSAIVPTTDRAMSFVPIILIPQVIFSGTVFPFKGWVTQILAMFFSARWSIGALGSTIGLHSDKLGGDNLLGTQSIYCGTLLSTCSKSQATTHLLWLWAALGAMILLFGFVMGIFLKLKDRHRQ